MITSTSYCKKIILIYNLCLTKFFQFDILEMLWHLSQVVRQRSAKPLSPVRIREVPPICPNGGIGRRKGLKIPREQSCAGSSPASGTKGFSRAKRVKSFLFVP